MHPPGEGKRFNGYHGHCPAFTTVEEEVVQVDPKKPAMMNTPSWKKESIQPNDEEPAHGVEGAAVNGWEAETAKGPAAEVLLLCYPPPNDDMALHALQR